MSTFHLRGMIYRSTVKCWEEWKLCFIWGRFYVCVSASMSAWHRRGSWQIILGRYVSPYLHKLGKPKILKAYIKKDTKKLLGTNSIWSQGRNYCICTFHHYCHFYSCFLLSCIFMIAIILFSIQNLDHLFLFWMLCAYLF
jgi:hypothetical protein